MKFLVFDETNPNELTDVLSFKSEEEKESYLKNNPGLYLEEVPDELDLEEEEDDDEIDDLFEEDVWS